MRIVISSRKSDLARIQAYRVGDALKKLNVEVEYRFRESLGDKNLTDPLWKMPEKGVFTEDFLEYLRLEKTDLVVHCCKFLPIDERDQTKIVATLPRADQRDLLLVRKDRLSQITDSKKIMIFSSSPRRAYNLEGFLKEALPGDIRDIQFETVRGNVPTRVQKTLTSKIDGLVVAKAALDRLLEAQEPEFKKMQEQLTAALDLCLVMILPLEQNPTAAAQGALAIEINSKRLDLIEILKPIHCEKTFKTVVEEREILKGYGGGCHQKVGASVRNFKFGKLISVKALTENGEIIDRFEFSPTQVSKKVLSESIFPETPSSSHWFKREPLDVKLPRNPLWIAKAEALPEDEIISHDQLVWTSGWEAWKRLAKKGVWVSGCSEGLGEDLGLESFAYWKNLNWTKLTHVDSTALDKKILGTYKLIPIKNSPSIEGKTHFFWMSGTSFIRALEIHPGIKTAQHSCGPGHTSETISKYVDVSIFPSYKIWKEQITL